ncbi:MAG TPA: DUF4388 domain-containing protein, partial [Vicinamibacteria bacterium]
FQDGSIFSSWSNDPRESLGQFLIRDRLVTEEQLFKALLAQEKEGRLIGSILVADGALDEEALRKSLQAKVEETVYDLFLWTEGSFEFKDNEVPEEILVHVDMPVTGVILEGIRRVDEWERIREVFPSARTTFKAKWVPHALDDPAERRALELVMSGRSLAEISLELRSSEFEAAALLFELFNRGVLIVDEPGEEPKGEVEPPARIQELLAVAYSKLQEKRYDDALRAYEDVLALDRLNQHAKKGLIGVAEARSRERALRSIPLGRVPVVAMDMATLTRENFDPLEGFVLSRVNGEWDVRSILKLCPMHEEDAILIFARLLERRVISFKES